MLLLVEGWGDLSGSRRISQWTRTCLVSFSIVSIRSKLGGAYGLGCGIGLIEERDPEHWSLKPEQGGGSLLDM